MSWIRKWGNPKPEIPETPDNVYVSDGSAEELVFEATPKDVGCIDPSPTRRAAKPLAKQFGKAMRDNLSEKDLRPFAKRCEVQVGTVTRVMSGVGTNLATLETVAREMGWTISVTDAKGKTLAQT